MNTPQTTQKEPEDKRGIRDKWISEIEAEMDKAINNIQGVAAKSSYFRKELTEDSAEAEEEDALPTHAFEEDLMHIYFGMRGLNRRLRALIDSIDL